MIFQEVGQIARRRSQVSEGHSIRYLAIHRSGSREPPWFSIVFRVSSLVKFVFEDFPLLFGHGFLLLFSIVIFSVITPELLLDLFDRDHRHQLRGCRHGFQERLGVVGGQPLGDQLRLNFD